MFLDSIDSSSWFINFTRRCFRQRVDLTWIKVNSSDIQSIFLLVGKWSLLTYVRDARKYNQYGTYITHTHAHAPLRSRAFANIEYSNYRLSISFPTGLLTISTCRCSASPAFASVLPRVGFSLHHRVFLSRARAHVFTRCIHFRDLTKRGFGCVPVHSPVIFWIIIVPC